MRLTAIGSVGPRPNAAGIAGAGVTRVQLQALDAGVLVTIVQLCDGSRVWRIRMVPTLFVQTTLAAPHAIVRGLQARDAIGEELAELLVRRHTTWGRVVRRAFHVRTVVFVVVFLFVMRYLRDVQATFFPRVPHTLQAYPRVQALILIRYILAVTRGIP